MEEAEAQRTKGLAQGLWAHNGENFPGSPASGLILLHVFTGPSDHKKLTETLTSLLQTPSPVTFPALHPTPGAVLIPHRVDTTTPPSQGPQITSGPSSDAVLFFFSILFNMNTRIQCFGQIHPTLIFTESIYCCCAVCA